ncbi:MAG: hypothetical protein EON54_09185 [Alcaligenaceae bacterium]|nr:MAG: hypothetical protein EON54_09185 [Alcaligenaceae bacterium]
MPTVEPNDDFIHMDVCIGRLGNCHRTLLSVKADQSHPLAGPAFQFALVDYCTVFTASQAADKSRRWLEEKMVPDELQELHRRILGTRNQQLAHADMSILDGVIAFQEFEGRLMTTTTMNHVDPLAELRNLDDIVLLVEHVLSSLFVSRRTRLEALRSFNPSQPMPCRYRL